MKIVKKILVLFVENLSCSSRPPSSTTLRLRVQSREGEGIYFIFILILKLHSTVYGVHSVRAYSKRKKKTFWWLNYNSRKGRSVSSVQCMYIFYVNIFKNKNLIQKLLDSKCSFNVEIIYFFEYAHTQLYTGHFTHCTSYTCK